MYSLYFRLLRNFLLILNSIHVATKENRLSVYVSNYLATKVNNVAVCRESQQNVLTSF